MKSIQMVHECSNQVDPIEKTKRHDGAFISKCDEDLTISRVTSTNGFLKGSNHFWELAVMLTSAIMHSIHTRDVKSQCSAHLS